MHKEDNSINVWFSDVFHSSCTSLYKVCGCSHSGICHRMIFNLVRDVRLLEISDEFQCHKSSVLRILCVTLMKEITLDIQSQTKAHVLKILDQWSQSSLEVKFF